MASLKMPRAGLFLTAHIENPVAVKHPLFFKKNADGWRCQDTEGIRASDGHSPPGECRQMTESGHGKELSE